MSEKYSEYNLKIMGKWKSQQQMVGSKIWINKSAKNFSELTPIRFCCEHLHSGWKKDCSPVFQAEHAFLVGLLIENASV